MYFRLNFENISLQASRPSSSLARDNNSTIEKLLKTWGKSFLVGCDMLIICPCSKERDSKEMTDTEQQIYQNCEQIYTITER
jgi:hypothetical protein